MAIYTTFFLCEPRRLLEQFPGATPPLAEPRPFAFVNPFTGEQVSGLTHEPDWTGVEPPSDGWWVDTEVKGVAGTYARYLEWRLPTFIRSLPHWCGKNLLHSELEPLIVVVTDRDDLRLEAPPFYIHPAIADGICQFPESFVHELGNAVEETLLKIATKWAAILSTPPYTHSASGKRVQDDWRATDALSVLRPIADLAKQASEGEALYLLIQA